MKESMKELRIGLVLYGGASLAVYMNGIVTELWHALRASQARHGGEEARLDGTAAVYARLLDTLAATAGVADLRIVVDAIAGTSAGGVNGAVLAKAVIDGADASVLNDVWIAEAELAEGKLRAEPALHAPFVIRFLSGALTTLWWPARRLRQMVDGQPGLSWSWALDQAWSFLKERDGRSTILDGRYFGRMIAATFKRMAERSGPPLLPRHGTFDLFLTRTDFHGWPRHLPVSPRFAPDPLYERTHAHWMWFRRRPPQTAESNGGFDERDADFALTYATRSTAGFPLAFAPVSYDDLALDFHKARPDDAVPPAGEFYRRHLPEHRLARVPGEARSEHGWSRHAWMIDGGLLDNRPFSYVADAIERKPADHEVFRIVMYVEPDPEPDLELSPPDPPPSMAIAKGLFKLFRHEPIYADLARLDERNSKVRRIREIVAAGRDNALRAAQRAGNEARPGLQWPPRADELDRWREATNAYAGRDPLSGYPGYVALKARRSVDLLAAMVCCALDYPYESRHGYFVRVLLRAWFEARGALAAPVYMPGRGHRMDEQLRLLGGLDIAFRLRRLRTLAQALRPLYEEHPEDSERAVLDTLKTALARSALVYQAAVEDRHVLREMLLATLGAEVADEIDRAIEDNNFDPTATVDRYGEAIAALYDRICTHFGAIAEEQNAALTQALQQLPPWAAGPMLAEFVSFPFFDLITFPMMDSAGLEDLIEVETMRISPRDAVLLSQDPLRLAGRQLGAFAAFLQRSSREHDLMWGRLDGIERLVSVIVAAAATPAADAARLEEIRLRFTREAMAAALDQEAARPHTQIGKTIAELKQKVG